MDINNNVTDYLGARGSGGLMTAHVMQPLSSRPAVTVRTVRGFPRWPMGLVMIGVIVLVLTRH